MIVCVCNAISEDELRTVVRCGGAPCPPNAFATLGCEAQCGTCLPYAQEIIDEVRSDMTRVDAKAA
ncbi:MAG: (2Fe-2S)-binding protein [Sphingomicrobium sp.]